MQTNGILILLGGMLVVLLGVAISAWLYSERAKRAPAILDGTIMSAVQIVIGRLDCFNDRREMRTTLKFPLWRETRTGAVLVWAHATKYKRDICVSIECAPGVSADKVAWARQVARDLCRPGLDSYVLERAIVPSLQDFAFA